MATFAFVLLAAVAPGADGFTTGVQDPHYLSSDQGVRDSHLDRTANTGAGIVRLAVTWRGIASGQPADPKNPADPAYGFADIDAAVQDATARGLTPLFVFNGTPPFAAQSTVENEGLRGAELPDPKMLADFVTAVATRYSGTFEGLPKVRYYETWNEPNLFQYLSPQWQNGKPVAAQHYQEMQNAVYAAVHAVDDANKSIAGSQAPYGDDPGGLRTRPLAFLREIFCLTKSLRKRSGCTGKTHFDILSHHPINLSGPPRQSAINPDDASSPDMPEVEAVLRAAERAGTAVGGPDHHPLWATEFWWESAPDGGAIAIPGLVEHGRWVEEELYLLWKQDVKVAIQYLLVDEDFDPQHPGDSTQSGLILSGGEEKPAYTAFRFPFVTERPAKRGPLTAWGISPASGKLTIERKSGSGWKRVDRENVKAGKVFTTQLKQDGKATFRASIGKEASLPWKQGKKVDSTYEVSAKTAQTASAPRSLRESP